MKNKSIGKVQSKRGGIKKRQHINFLDFMIIFLGLLGWCFLAWFIWGGYIAYINGDTLAQVLFRWNAHNEMIIELILINSMIVIMLIYLFIRVFGIKRRGK